MLSQENVNKLVMSGLYEKIPPDYTQNTYWCTNWTFVVSYNNGKYFMVDTYFKNSSVELTNENFHEFDLIMNFELVKQVSEEQFLEYGLEHRFRVATDSGGWRYAKYYVLKYVKPQKRIKRIILLNKINNLKSTLKLTEDELSGLDLNEHYE